jgi:hypothetical protein
VTDTVVDNHIAQRTVEVAALRLVDSLALHDVFRTVAVLAVGVEPHMRTESGKWRAAGSSDARGHLDCTQKLKKATVHSFGPVHAAGIAVVLALMCTVMLLLEALAAEGAGRTCCSVAPLHSACPANQALEATADHSDALKADSNTEDAAAIPEYSAKLLGGTLKGLRGSSDDQMAG